MTKHTPGPWYHVNDFGIWDAPNHPAQVIAECDPADVRNAEAFANADLIAAAPDLLECAKMLALVCAENALENTPERAEILATARAAIAKAEGRG